MPDFTWRVISGSGNVTGVSVLRDGTLLGVGTPGGGLYTRSNVACWMSVPQSGGVRSVSVLAGGTLLGVGTNGLLSSRNTLYGAWVAIPGSTPFLDVIQLQDGSFLGVQTNNLLYSCAKQGAPWIAVAQSPPLLSVAQLGDATLLGVGTDNQLWTCSQAGRPWQVWQGSGPVVDAIQLPDRTLLGVGTDNQLYTANAIGAPWIVVPYSTSLLAVAQLPDTTFVAVGTDNTLYTSPALPSVWTLATQPDDGSFLSAVQLQDETFLGVKTDNTLWSCPALGSSWSPVSSDAPLISITQIFDRTLLGVGTDNQLLTSPSAGAGWTSYPGSGPMLAAIQMLDGTLLGVGTDQMLHTTSGPGVPWTTIPNSGSMIGVAQQAEGTLVGIGADTTVYVGRYSHLLGKIDHIVFFMLENRGFDSLLGYLYSPGSPPAQVIPSSTADHPFHGLEFVKKPSKLANSATINGQVVTLEPGYPVRATDSPGTDPFEEFEHVNAQLFGSQANPSPGTQPSMTGFLADFAGRFGTHPSSFQVGEIEQIMSIYTPVDVPILSTLARAYAVSDRWFSSVPTQTNANRAFSMTGTSLGEVNNGFHATGKINREVDLDSFQAETIFNVLERSGFDDWGVFWQVAYPPVIQDQPYTWNSFPMIDEYVSDARSHFHPIAQFFDMAAKGTLPAFSFIEPYWGGAVRGVVVNGNDYHPPADTFVGELFLKQLFTALQRSPTWSSTLLVITFDEHGGTYDHVPPPWGATPPWGAGKPAFPLDHDFAFDRFGVRIPTLLVSPLIAEGTVFRSPTPVPYDHTSIIATVLDWQQVDKRTWNLGARVAAAPTFDNAVTLTAARSDDPFAPTQAPPDGTPMTYGAPFYLVNQPTGSSVVKAKSGTVYYYPTLGTEGAVAHAFRLGFGPLTSGSQVQIYTSEWLPNKWHVEKGYVMLASPSTAMGAWADQTDCYYYPTEDYEDYQQQVWIIEKVGARPGDPILFGDSVYLSNGYYAGSGLVANGSYLTTAAGKGDVWVLQPAPG